MKQGNERASTKKNDFSVAHGTSPASPAGHAYTRLVFVVLCRFACLSVGQSVDQWAGQRAYRRGRGQLEPNRVGRLSFRPLGFSLP